MSVLAVIVGYLLGSIPFGLLLTRSAGLGDIRKVGSGNIGATNVLRTGRKGLAAATLLLDGAKGAVAVLIGAILDGDLGMMLGGIAGVAGHAFPVWLNFRGGKSVATGFGALIAANPVIGLIAGAIWIAVAAVTRISSASSLTAFALAPVLALFGHAGWFFFVLALVVATVIWARHRANIERLLAGTEPRIGAK